METEKAQFDKQISALVQEPDHPDTYTVVWDENEGQWAVKFHGDITMPLSRLRRAYGFVAKVIGTIHDKI